MRHESSSGNTIVPEEDAEPHTRSEENPQDFKDEEKAEKRPGSPSQQPNSQKAHVDPGYYTLNPWYGQPNDRGPTFSTAWPLPRTVRRGMLNDLDIDSLREKDDEQQDPQQESRRSGKEHEHAGMPQLDKSQLDYIVFQLAQQLAKNQQPSSSSGDSMPPDIRNEQQRPTPHVNHDDESERDHEDGVPPDIRREDMRPTTGVPPKEHTDKKTHHLTPQSRHQDTSDEKNQEQGIMDQIRNQAVKKESTPQQKHETPASRARDEQSTELRNRWARLRARAPEPLAEFVATAITVYIGLAASLSKTTSNGQYGSFETQSLAWGFGTMFGIYVAGGVSGAHLNPAISITLSLFRGFPWRRCGIYIVAQLLGGLVAAAISFAVYHDAIYNFDPTLSPEKSGIALFTLPQPFISVSTAFFNEFVAGVILMTVLLALGDDTNAPPGAGMNAFILGLLVTTLIWCSAYQTGLALNPARDFGPRLVALWMGYPRSIFTGYNWWWLWGGFIAPLVGCITGCTVYDTMVFSGGESPLNYRWPSRKEFVRQLRGKGRRTHDHVNAHAKV
ncbi:hypothetical protein AAFC00_005280 [Neodothiora populina]|uniref:Aquaporin-like protein n=1 Tax=Neodothiora populina TaxID=2781224 RepID=A0ABR3PKD5_9PEZI